MKQLKVCIVGSMGHFDYVLQGLRADNQAVLAGIAPGSTGEDITALEQAVEASGFNCEKFERYQEMFDQLQPDIVGIASYFNDHAAITVEALHRGMHVFVEKPVATTLDDLERVKNACRKTKVHLAAMFGLRYTPWFFTAYQAVRDGFIGNVRLINAQKSYKLGNRHSPYKQRVTYGGTIPWVGSHAVDWIYWIGGESFKSVYASHSTKYNKEHDELEVSALCQFICADEVFGSVSIDYLRPENSQQHGDDRLRVVGTKGILEVRDQKVYLLDGDSPHLRELPMLPEENIFYDFLQGIRGIHPCRISAEDSFAVTDACLRARQSADENRVISF